MNHTNIRRVPTYFHTPSVLTWSSSLWTASTPRGTRCWRSRSSTPRRTRTTTTAPRGDRSTQAGEGVTVEDAAVAAAEAALTTGHRLRPATRRRLQTPR